MTPRVALIAVGSLVVAALVFALAFVLPDRAFPFVFMACLLILIVPIALALRDGRHEVVPKPRPPSERKVGVLVAATFSGFATLFFAVTGGAAEVLAPLGLLLTGVLIFLWFGSSENRWLNQGWFTSKPRRSREERSARARRRAR